MDPFERPVRLLKTRKPGDPYAKVPKQAISAVGNRPAARSAVTGARGEQRHVDGEQLVEGRAERQAGVEVAQPRQGSGE